MLLTCTTVQRGRGPQLSSAWRALGSQPRRLGTWRCSLGATPVGREQEVRCCAKCWGCAQFRARSKSAFAAVIFAPVMWLRVSGLAFLFQSLQAAFFSMLLTCTTVQRGRGRRLGSAWRAVNLQPHRLGTWRCSLGVGHKVRRWVKGGASILMRAFTGAIFDVVDLYNSATGAWSTARLSVARSRLAATSVGNTALFAGGGLHLPNELPWRGWV